MKKLASAGLGLILAVAMSGVGFAATTTVTGHLRDSFCYNVTGASGSGHAKCAKACAKAGIPVALVLKNGDQVILLPPKNGESLPADVISNMEKKVSVTGTEYKKGGVTYLQVESVK